MLSRRSLNKSITATATRIVLFLKLNLFNLSEWRKNSLDIIFCKVEMDISNVQTMNWCLFRRSGATTKSVLHKKSGYIRSSSIETSLTIFLRFSNLNNDGNPKKSLSGHTDSFRNRPWITKFNISDTVRLARYYGNGKPTLWNVQKCGP